MTTTKYLIGALATTLFLLGGSLYATANAGDEAREDGDARRAVVGPVISEMRTVAIEPCRIVDTRFGGGGRLNNETRNFDARGALSGQGGASDCGIPSSAEAIEGNITAVDPGPKGFLRVKAFDGDDTIASGTVVNYAGSGITNATTIPLCVGTCTEDFSISATGNSTHVVVDVTAYMVPPMFAVFDGDVDNLLISGKRLAFNSENGEGEFFFDVTDGTDIRGCAMTATGGTSDDNQSGANAGDTVIVQADDKHSIVVTTTDADGSANGDDLMVVVHC